MGGNGWMGGVGWGGGGCFGGLETVKAGSLGAKLGWEKPEKNISRRRGGGQKSGGGILRGSRWKKSEMLSSGAMFLTHKDV